MEKDFLLVKGKSLDFSSTICAIDKATRVNNIERGTIYLYMKQCKLLGTSYETILLFLYT